MTRAWRIVFSTVFILILLVNLTMFIVENETFAGNYWIHIQFYKPLYNSNGGFHFRGIAEFAKYLETFPALQNCQVLVSRLSIFLSGDFHPTNNDILDYVNGIFMLLTVPVEIIIAFLIDVFNNLLWVFGFFFPNWFGA